LIDYKKFRLKLGLEFTSPSKIQLYTSPKLESKWAKQGNPEEDDQELKKVDSEAFKISRNNKSVINKYFDSQSKAQTIVRPHTSQNNSR
jgi:hypothetical protein